MQLPEEECPSRIRKKDGRGGEVQVRKRQSWLDQVLWAPVTEAALTGEDELRTEAASRLFSAQGCPRSAALSGQLGRQP